MGKFSLIGMILFGFVLTACSPKGPEGSVDLESKLKSGKKLASQSGVTINEGYIELLKQVNPNLDAQLKSPLGKKRLVDSLLEQELLYQASLKKGIQNQPKYREKAALYERVIISQGMLEEEIDIRAKKYYDENKEEEFSEVGVQHILFRIQKPNPAIKDDKGVTEQDALAKANEAKKKLDEGVAWETVVAEYSDDRLTKPRAGDLGKISREDRRVQRLQWQELVDKAFAMKMGDISDPIKAQDGYHIIKITTAAGVASYPDVENRIKFKLRAQVKEEIMKDLGGGKIEYEDEELVKISEPGAPGMMPKGPAEVHGAPSANRPITKPQIPGHPAGAQPAIPPQAPGAKAPEPKPQQ
jgi:parvulin-like peptidyl-prolyl isomerase